MSFFCVRADRSSYLCCSQHTRNVDYLQIYEALTCPFHFKTQHILWKNVLSAEVRKYNALREYGGWGIKGWTAQNRAYNVDGNIGLQLVLRNGKRVLIGTKQSEKLEALLYDLKIPKPEHG